MKNNSTSKLSTTSTNVPDRAKFADARAWKSITAAEFCELEIPTPDAGELEYRSKLLENIAIDCARCGDTVDGIFSFLRYKRTEFGLELSDSSLHVLAKTTFEAWWSLPQNLVKGGAYDFVLGPLDGHQEGAFPLGEVSAIQGASGSGKSRLAYTMLLDQRDGLEVFGRPTYGRDFFVVMLDRSANSLTRTLDGLGITEDELPHRILTPEQEQQQPHEVLADLWSQRQGAQVIFIEGLDLWCRDVNSMHIVQQLLSPIQKFAQRTHTAVIASIGSPKMKVREGYKSPRDRAIGSSAWARKIDTVLDIVEDVDSGIRHISLLTRGTEGQRWRARFVEGRLEEYKPSITVEIDKGPAEYAPDEAKVMSKAGYSRAEIAEKFGVHIRTVHRWLK